MRYAVKIYVAVNQENSGSGDSRSLVANWVQLLIFLQKYGKLLPEHSGLQLYPDLWPASSKIFENSPPGAWPHPTERPNFPLPIKCLWTNQEDDGFWLDKLNEMTAEIRTFAIEQQCTTADAPIYYNLALDGTPVETIYRENYSELKPLRREVDRNNLMSLTGGFRIV